MSDLEARKRAVQEQDYHEQAQRVVKQLELRETRKVGQGEFLGDMIGGYGKFASQGFTGLFMRAVPAFNILIVGGWFAYLLWSAT